ncbi:hypothetical protein BCR41DRAFT_321764 [Lobosporangium transversale]|uniref:RPEL repeat protein n=1 Tax=Lobosporangium transversale TaxID=64571 RepID=A0A1Y2GQ17_9FUNG|nr:hypothetical protein BCR41DRAFT_321764 [Lobosporangium transversale]ORZ18382.1 hypothetical protein BCR41DRAFT_321764 [Lobosporangium transversale]|eukprot:XP_021882177.1 hypothetical protein BCR41DRAFT_321764 [Lobosporangium transversale]
MADNTDKTRASEELETFLKHRPDREELVEKNILKDSHVAPALQRKEEELKRSQLEDLLNTKITQRPTVEALVEKHILEA